MVYTIIFRQDLVNGDHSQTVGFAIIAPTTIEDMHDQATRACTRQGGTAYQLYRGDHFENGKPISLRHRVD